MFNLSGTANVFRLLLQPTLCLPQQTVSHFGQLPVPLNRPNNAPTGDEKSKEILAVVLDKDNCFAEPDANEVYPPYKAKFEELRAAYPGSRLLIVSNTAGTQDDRGHQAAELIERTTGVTVLRHAVKKPGCREEVLRHFREAADVTIQSPSQIAVVGDRLFTDVMMANLMGSHGVWVKDGVVPNTSIFANFEKSLADFLLRRGYQPPEPKSHFE